jgi:hypothetical protein
LIIWLASYPRSGNHLLRTILRRSFGLNSFEIYQPIALPIGEQVSQIVGAERFAEADVSDFLHRARSDPGLFLVKTHQRVPATDKCIYIVRDARAALVSLQRYRAEVEGKGGTLRELITGQHWPGKWHANVRGFLQRDSSNTLVLRYEALASEQPPLAEIGAFLGVEPIREFDISFGTLNEMSPTLFPTGSNSVGVDRVERECRWSFWLHCGEMMRTLGYVSDHPPGLRHAIAAFLEHPARYVGAFVWPAIKRLRSRLRGGAVSKTSLYRQ